MIKLHDPDPGRLYSRRELAMLSARPLPHLSPPRQTRASASAPAPGTRAPDNQTGPPPGPSATDLLTVIGRDGRFKRLAPRFAQAFGYAEADLLGQPFISFVHPDDRAATSAALDRLSNRQPTLGVENRFRCQDGVYWRLAWTALNTPEGFLYAIARRVTEQHQPGGAEAPAPTRARTTSALPREGSVAAVCHDLRQPLTVIMGQTQLLQRQLAGGESISTERLEEHLMYVFAAAKRMRDMTQELLDCSLEQAGQAPGLLLVRTDLVALARHLVSEHELISDVHQIRFESDLPTLEAEVDETRVNRLLTNLLTNAIKYSPGGGAVSVRVSSIEDASGSAALLVVRDEGVGIPADDLPHIFERFHRARNVVGRFAGTGVGLASARELVELHAGTISVESGEGHGSTFSVRLPLAPPIRSAASVALA